MTDEPANVLIGSMIEAECVEQIGAIDVRLRVLPLGFRSRSASAPLTKETSRKALSVCSALIFGRASQFTPAAGERA
jgi:hypothetical protein